MDPILSSLSSLPGPLHFMRRVPGVHRARHPQPQPSSPSPAGLMNSHTVLKETGCTATPAAALQNLLSTDTGGWSQCERFHSEEQRKQPCVVAETSAYSEVNLLLHVLVVMPSHSQCFV